MYDSMAPVEFKSLLDPTWRQHQEEALSEFIEKELEKDQSPESAVKNIDNEFDLLSGTIKKHFMTLMSSSLQAAQKAAYEDAGIENYKVIAVIDDNTCEKCFEVNDKVLPVKDYEIAQTAPPYHFYCRCTTMPYTSDSADKTGTHNAVVLFIKEFISQAASITINNLSWANILELPSKVKGIIELVYELAKVSEALRKKEISINDVRDALGDKAKDIFIGDLIYIFENYKKFGNLSELSEQDIKELAGRTAGAYEEAVAAGFTIYGISKSLSQITKKISIANAKKVPPKPSTSSNGAGQYADDVIEGAESSLNKLPKTTAESVSTKLDSYLLEPTHPVGGSKAKWFKEALGFTKDNSTDLAKQIVFDPKKAVQTATNAHGTKFSQVIPIQGTNGKIINVDFIFIKNNDGVIRLVTSIPTKR